MAAMAAMAAMGATVVLGVVLGSASLTLKMPPSLQGRARTRLRVMGTVQEQTPPPMASSTMESLIQETETTPLSDRLQQQVVLLATAIVLPTAFMEKESSTLGMVMTKLLPPAS